MFLKLSVPEHFEIIGIGVDPSANAQNHRKEQRGNSERRRRLARVAARPEFGEYYSLILIVMAGQSGR